jgi:hypothetical protein
VLGNIPTVVCMITAGFSSCADGLFQRAKTKNIHICKFRNIENFVENEECRSSLGQSSTHKIDGNQRLYYTLKEDIVLLPIKLVQAATILLLCEKWRV